MSRLLSDAPCSVTFFDKISGSSITLYYRLPTTEQRIKYANSYVTRVGKNVEASLGENRVNNGMAILTGFKEGDFTKGKDQPLSSDPKSKNFDPGWKEILRKYASDIIAQLAIHAFEGTFMVVEDTDTQDPI